MFPMMMMCGVILSACEGKVYRDPSKCHSGHCLKQDANWSQCYKECTCGCWKTDSQGVYPDAIIATGKPPPSSPTTPSGQKPFYDPERQNAPGYARTPNGFQIFVPSGSS